MTTPTIKYRVDSIHINVGQGDGAIHLLVDPQLIQDDKPTVKRACLVDGGEWQVVENDGNMSGNERIRLAISRIKQNYFLSEKHSSDDPLVMRFDSVVITHWDSDHYGGIGKLIKDDFENQWKSIKPKEDPEDEAEFTKYEKDFKDKMAPHRCRYFQYEKTTMTPTTTLYAPYWYFSAEENLELNVSSAKGFRSIRFFNGDSNDPSDGVPLNAKTLTFKLTDSITIVEDSKKPKRNRKGPKTVEANIENLCNLCYDPEEMMGVNFFNNARRESSEYEKIENPEKLKDLVKGTDGAPVGIYCVACRGRVIGSPDSFGSGPKSSFYMVEDPDASTASNRTSISAIVLWSNPFNITHYFAGDAWWYAEEAIATWIKQKIKKVPCMKLSHHGSSSSTPLNMVAYFQPDNIVISAGHDTTYKHPTWGVLMYLNAWLYASGKTRAVFATRYPYYCDTEFGKDKDGTCVKFIKTSGDTYEEIFWTKWAEEFKDLRTQGLRVQAKEWKKRVIDEGNATNSDYNYTSWMTWQVKNAWDDNLSPMYRGRLAKTSAQPNSVDQVLIRSELEDPPPKIKIAVEFKFENELVTFVDAEDRKRVEELEASKEATAPADRPVLYSDIDEALLRLKKPHSQYHMKDDAQFPRSLDETFHRTEALSPDEGHWLGPVDGPGTNAIAEPRLSSFVSHLHCRRFGVLKIPGANSEIDFLANEEWNCWFKDALSSTSLQLSTNSYNDPSGFLFEMKPSIAKQAGLKFDTRLVPLAFDPPPTLLPTLGLIGDTNIMVFGLDTTRGMESATMSEILRYIKLEVLTISPLVQAFGDQISLSLSTEKGARNAIWFEPGLAYRTTLRLQWKVDKQPLLHILESSGIRINVTKLHVITSRITSWRPDLTMIPRGELRLDVTISGPSVDFLGSITVGKDSFGVRITTAKLDWTNFLNWLSQKVPGVDISFIAQEDSPLSAIKDLFDTKIVPRRASFEVKHLSGKHSLKSWTVSIEIIIKSVPFLVTYSSGLKLLCGQIWLDPGDVGVQRLLPGWEESDVLRPSPGSKSELDLADLDPDGGVEFIPKNIPTKLKEVSVWIDPKSISFFASLVCSTPSKDESIPAISLGTVRLSAQYLFQGIHKFSLKLYCNAILSQTVNRNTDDGQDQNDEDDEDDDSASSQSVAMLDGVIEYDEGVWTLAGSIDGLSFKSIYSLLDPRAQDDVLSVLGNLKLSNLRLVYSYQKNGEGSDFFLTGNLSLGKLELAMTYTYDSNGWFFKAELGSSTENETVGTIVRSMLDDDDDVLPDFLANIPIASGEAGDKLVTIRCRKSAKSPKPTDKREDHYILFQATLKIRVFGKTSAEVTFAQYRDLALNSKDPAKRILKVSLVELPTVTVPTLGKMPQPFDEMAFLWVQDKKAPGKTDNKAGLTEQEVKFINQGVPTSDAGQAQSSEDWLFYRDTRKPEQAKPTDLVISAGSHFIVMLNASNQRRAILDYAFQTKQKPMPLEYSPYSVTAGSGADGNSATAAYQKTAGPISINNIGLKFKDNVLSVIVDATFVLGPIGFTFLDAAIKINLKNKTIQDLTDAVSFSLGGLVVAFDRPPLRLAGAFIHGETEGMTYYAGGLVVGFDPYQLTAAGMYGEVKEPKGFKTAFVFAKLEGPLVTLAFAEISGVTGGFGYNSEIRKPTIETVHEFAFFNSKLISNDLITTLGNLMKVDGSGTFTVRDGSIWLAAGLKVSAFKMLSIDAAIVVSWNPSVIIAIYGVAVADIPKGTGVTFAHIELGIAAAIDFEAGVFKVEAQLAPSSYLFDSSCRLTGGFALFYWFNDRVPELQGDWVFTVGGYHRAFIKPTHYPNPPRLGISWQVGSDISIVGEAYFAITPKCCMGGGRLRATLSAGPLTAWYSTWADFLIKYQPFYFMAEGGVSIGISCKVDLLITSFTVSVEVGASLSLAGPPLHGRVHIDFWVMSFNIHFGPNAEAPDPPNLEGFHQMVLQSKDQQSLAAMLMAAPTKPGSTATSKDDHVFTCRGGLVEGKGDETITTENANWLVKAGSFAFAIDVHFALSDAEVMPPEEFGDPYPNMKPLEFHSSEKIYAKPMENNKEITSKLTVTIKAPKAFSTTSEPDEINDHHWQVTEIIKEVPSALWGNYNENDDPGRQGNHVKSLLNAKQGTIPLLMGLEIRAPKPRLADDKIGKFDAVKAMEQEVFVEKDRPDFPIFNDQRPDWSARPLQPGEKPNDQKSYDNVKSIWGETSVSERQAVVDALARGLAWRKKLTAATPTRLVGDLWNKYMCAPGISVA